MRRGGGSREDLALTLRAAYARGLLSDETFALRTGTLLADPVVRVEDIVGDLSAPERAHRVRGRLRKMRWMAKDLLESALGARRASTPTLALDWDASDSQVLVGRSSGCGLRFRESSVSRRHARLLRRDSSWILQDLDSTNGSFVNGRRVGRCELRPGDRIRLGEVVLRVI